MLLIGLILFVFLLILFWRGVVFVVGKIGKAKGQEQKYRKYTTYLGVFIAIATILFFIADEIYTKKQFEQLCKKEAGLKIYKTVGNVDGFLFFKTFPKISDMSTYKLTKGDYVDFAKFNYIEQEHGYPYELKGYETVNENGIYKINGFIFERNRTGSPYSKIIKKQLDFEKFTGTNRDYGYHTEFKLNVDRSYFNNEEYHFQLVDKQTTPISKYAFIRDGNNGKYDFYYAKSAIIDIDDYSILAESKSFTNYGGKYTHILSWLYSGYRSPISKGSCGSGLLYPEFIHKILQPVTVRERNKS